MRKVILVVIILAVWIVIAMNWTKLTKQSTTEYIKVTKDVKKGERLVYGENVERLALQRTDQLRPNPFLSTKPFVYLPEESPLEKISNIVQTQLSDNPAARRRFTEFLEQQAEKGGLDGNRAKEFAVELLSNIGKLDEGSKKAVTSVKGHRDYLRAAVDLQKGQVLDQSDVEPEPVIPPGTKQWTIKVEGSKGSDNIKKDGYYDILYTEPGGRDARLVLAGVKVYDVKSKVDKKTRQEVVTDVVVAELAQDITKLVALSNQNAPGISFLPGKPRALGQKDWEIEDIREHKDFVRVTKELDQRDKQLRELKKEIATTKQMNLELQDQLRRLAEFVKKPVTFEKTEEKPGVGPKKTVRIFDGSVYRVYEIDEDGRIAEPGTAQPPAGGASAPEPKGETAGKGAKTAEPSGEEGGVQRIVEEGE